jgi:L-methionine (R)-S-oxide reductase
MAENLNILPSADRATQYESLLPQIRSLIEDEPDLIANLANVAAVLKEAFGFFWVGFYLMKEGELVLGPFQGPLACTRIAMGKGVCGAAAQRQSTLVVPDVEQFPGHIACSSLSRSEIVVPILNGDKVLGVLDVDSEHLAHFDQVDAHWLEQIIADLVAQHWGRAGFNGLD